MNKKIYFKLIHKDGTKSGEIYLYHLKPEASQSIADLIQLSSGYYDHQEKCYVRYNYQLATEQFMRNLLDKTTTELDELINQFYRNQQISDDIGKELMVITDNKELRAKLYLEDQDIARTILRQRLWISYYNEALEYINQILFLYGLNKEAYDLYYMYG